jgi:hypothetical protein
LNFQYDTITISASINNFNKNVKKEMMGNDKDLTPHDFWNITDFDAKCEKCATINTVTLEMGELKKLV